MRVRILVLSLLFVLCALVMNSIEAVADPAEWQRKGALLQEPDFVLLDSDCKIAAGGIGNEKGVQIFPGDRQVWICSRERRKVRCLIAEENAKDFRKAPMVVLDMVLEAKSTLILKNAKNDGGDLLSIDTGLHSAVTTSRIVHEHIIGAKVCQQIYLTADEYRDFKASIDGAKTD